MYVHHNPFVKVKNEGNCNLNNFSIFLSIKASADPFSIYKNQPVYLKAGLDPRVAALIPNGVRKAIDEYIQRGTPEDICKAVLIWFIAAADIIVASFQWVVNTLYNAAFSSGGDFYPNITKVFLCYASFLDEMLRLSESVLNV